MAYVMLIIEPAGDRDTRAADVADARYQAMQDFTNELTRRGVLVTSQSLKSDTQGVRIRADGEGVRLTDGPFAEAREMVGGFFLLQNVNRDEALAIARACPAVGFATVELRETGPCNEA